MTDDATRSRAAGECPKCGEAHHRRKRPFRPTSHATPDRASEQTIEKLRNALLDLCDLHHRTLTGSAKHNPARIASIHECPCLSCRRVSAVLAETETER